ncbi:hypothetical protein LTR53_015274, partial [Teratosphaeriaceae sp. CCFEE 6253]
RFWDSWKLKLRNIIKKLRGPKAESTLAEEGYGEVEEPTLDLIEENVAQVPTGKYLSSIDEWLEGADEFRIPLQPEDMEWGLPEEVMDDTGTLFERPADYVARQLGKGPEKGPYRFEPGEFGDEDGFGDFVGEEAPDDTIVEDPDMRANQAFDKARMEAQAEVHQRPVEASETVSEAESMTDPTESGEWEPPPNLPRPEDLESVGEGGTALDGTPEAAPELSADWSPEAHMKAEMEGLEHPHTSTMDRPTTAEFKEALEEGDPVAEAEVSNFGVDGAGAAEAGGINPEFEAAEGAAEEVAIESAEAGEIALFDVGFEVVLEGVIVPLAEAVLVP